MGDGRWLIAVDGELDLAVSDQLQAALERSVASTTIVSLSECQFMDSTGVAVILRARHQAVEEGRRLVLCCAEDQVQHLLAVMGLDADDGFVFPTLEAALKELE